MISQLNSYLKLVPGISGIVEAYQRAVSCVQLWGPTNISPIINHVARFASQSQSQETSPSVSTSRLVFNMKLPTQGDLVPQ